MAGQYTSKFLIILDDDDLTNRIEVFFIPELRPCSGDLGFIVRHTVKSIVTKFLRWAACGYHGTVLFVFL